MARKLPKWTISYSPNDQYSPEGMLFQLHNTYNN